uniref:Small ribosomal subunit protein uS17c n=1 Tax=Cryptomonas sp. CCAC 1634B TaxID=2051848 RepID=A0A679C9Z1_9CRYP|nr:ribosomal protein S17 [Cryptomonas sp. CCAC 1634B]
MSTKERSGVVVSNKMQKTIIVSVQTRITHKRYGKIMTKTKRYKAHDEANESKLGDFVTILETKPLSKTKRWVLQSIHHFSSSMDHLHRGE